MAPNPSLTVDVSGFGDALHRDLYVRDTYQSAADTILNQYYQVQNGIATAIAAKQVQLSSGEGSISLFTAPVGAGLDIGSQTPVMTLAGSETDINSSIVNFAGTSVHLTNSGATFTNNGNTALTGTLGVTGATTLHSTSEFVGTATADSDVNFAGASSTFTNSGFTVLAKSATLQDTLAVTGAVTADSNVTFAGTSSTFTNAGTTHLQGVATVGGTLDVTGAATLHSTSEFVGTATADSDVNFAGASSTFTNSGFTVLAKSATLQDTLAVTGAVTADSNVTFAGTSSTFTNAGTTHLQGVATVGGTLDVTGATTLHSTSEFVGTATADSDVNFTGTSSTFTNSGSTVLGGILNANGAIMATDTVSFVGTSKAFTVAGPTTINNSLTVTGTLGFNGDLDMNNHNVLNVATVSHGSDLSLSFDNVGTSISTYVGTGASPIMQVTPTGVNVNGNLTITGSATEVTIQSSTIKVQDKNIELGYQEADLASCDGAGFTIGDATATIPYTLPTLLFKNYTSPAFLSNVDLRTNGGTSYSVLTQGTVGVVSNDGLLSAYLQHNALQFSNKWRLRYDDVNDQMKFERYDGTEWVTKFTFTT